MSRKFQPKDIEAIEKLRNALKESSNSSNTIEDQSTFDDNGLDQFHHDLLIHEKVIDAKITGHQLIVTQQKSKQFISYQIEVITLDLNYKISRRFSQFHNLYKKIRKNMNVKCQFPKKVYNPFVSSTHQSVIQQRSNKLHFFLKEVLAFIKISKNSFVTFTFFSFLAIKYHYEQKMIINNYKKSNSEKLSYYRMISMKSSLSEGINQYQASSLEFKLLLLNSQSQNAQKCLKEIEQFVKFKKSKLSNEDIKILLLGCENCDGILKYGLTNSIQINRINALELLLNFILPERNPYFQKFEKFIEKIPIQQWRVQQINHFQNPIFKVLYFKLLNYFCQKIEKEGKTSESILLKNIFLFHQNFYTDYFQWKKMQQRENYWPSSGLNSVDETRRIQISEFEDEQFNFIQFSPQNSRVKTNICKELNIITFYFETTRLIQKFDNSLINWNRFVSNITNDNYTSIVRALLNINNHKINIRIKQIKQQQQQFNHFKGAIKSLGSLKEVQEIAQNYDFRMGKEEYPRNLQSEYFESIWVKKYEDKSCILMTIHFAGGIGGLNTTIQEITRCLREDIQASFPR